jgi:hypothetical protein
MWVVGSAIVYKFGSLVGEKEEGRRKKEEGRGEKRRNILRLYESEVGNTKYTKNFV